MLSVRLEFAQAWREMISDVTSSPSSKIPFFFVVAVSVLYIVFETYRFLYPKTSKHKYEGEFNASGEYHGKGKLTAVNGDIYEGEFKNGLFSGKGTYRFASGKGKYVGTFVAGTFHGHRGTETYPDGSVYTGSFAKGLRDGKGRMKYPDGSSYTGKWKHGKKHGQGIFVYSNGDRYVGGFAEGRRHGEGKIVDKKTGKMLSGVFKYGEAVKELVVLQGEEEARKIVNAEMEVEMPEKEDQSLQAKALRERIKDYKESLKEKQEAK